jgi:hypothetical protein
MTFSSLPLYKQLLLIFGFLVVPIIILFIWIDQISRKRAHGMLCGFSGLLLLLGFYCYFRVLVTIFQSLLYLVEISQLSRGHPPFAVYVESSFNVALILSNLIMLYLMATRSRHFIVTCIVINIWVVLIPLNDIFLLFFVNHDHTWKDISAVLLYYYVGMRVLAFVIFPIMSIVYVKFSTRVGNTFVGQPKPTSVKLLAG